MKYWSTSKTTFQICGKIDPNYTFEQKMPLGENCKESELKCGTHDDTFICINQTQTCPITTIAFQKSNASNFQQIQIDNDSFISFAINETNKLPLVEFRVSEADFICLQNNNTNIGINQTDYLLMSKVRESCDEQLNETDYRFTNISKIDEESFYLINNMTNILKKLPTFEISSDNIWKLFTRPYIGLKFDCRFDVRLLREMKSFVTLQSLMVKITTAITILLLFILLLLFFYSKSKKTRRADKINVVTSLALLICCPSLILIYTAIVFAKLNSVNNYLSYLIYWECSDDQTLDVFDQISTELEKFLNFDKTQLALISQIIVLNLLTAVYMFARSLKHKDQILKPVKFASEEKHNNSKKQNENKNNLPNPTYSAFELQLGNQIQKQDK